MEQQTYRRDLYSTRRAYEYMGVHREGKGFVFRVWAPRAQAVFAVGDFNFWSESAPMVRTDKDGIWECKISGDGFGNGSLYKFKLIVDGRELYRADPYAFCMENGGQGASRFFESTHSWGDGGWFGHRASSNGSHISIYNVDIVSECRRFNGSCEDIALLIASRAKAEGNTHIGLRAIYDAPHDGGTGLAVTGFFAPSYHLGDPDALCAFVDYMHRAGVGVILDWSPEWLSRHERGIALYDGYPLYEDARYDGLALAHFDISKDAVRSFLLSNALFWADRYHADGLRVRASDLNFEKFLGEIGEAMGEFFPNVILVWG